jgi:hypothetical protein
MSLTAPSKEILSKTVQGIAQWSFDLWQLADFREFIKFDDISQTEQDRIFNELQVTALGLVIFQLEDAFPVFKDITETDLINEFISLYENIGTEKQFIDMWRQVISMRNDEYRRDKQTLREESKDWEQLKSLDDDMILRWLRVETLTIDGVTHIRYGELDENDPLIPFFRSWMIVLDNQFMKILKPLQEVPLQS